MFITTTKASKILGVSRPTVVRMIRDGELHDLRAHLNGKHRRTLDLAEVQRMAQRLFTKTPPAVGGVGTSPIHQRLSALEQKLDTVLQQLADLTAVWS